MYVLHCTDKAGDSVGLRYDPHTSTLTNMDGTPVFKQAGERKNKVWDAVQRISPTQPGHKVANPVVLKIQLGLSCNYACSYCNQSSQVDLMAASQTADAEEFLADMSKWLKGSPSLIEFWGGEPLLYFKKLQILVPELDRRFPDAEFSMVTNGSLLTQEIVDFIATYDIRITLSHDGPGQPLRGDDPLDHPTRGPLIEALWQERKQNQRMVFSSVLTATNSDPVAIRRWFVNRLGDESVMTSLEGVVATHDDKALAGPGTWSATQYAQLRESLARVFETGEVARIPALLERGRNLVQSVLRDVPSEALGQKCAMDRPDHLAVDLHSNVVTCQNTGANSKHGLGSALAIDQIKLDTSTHWGHRDCCNHCPVLHVCGGSCMYLEGEQFAQSCENEYQFGLGVFDGVLRRTFGLKLEHIEGDVRRPAKRRMIPISVA